jgi:CheY-like chemotaxis protein/predicted Ser/Thr protein kinase
VGEGTIIVDGRYAIDHELGRGSMGVVYLAKDLGLDRAVALKLMSPEAAADKPSVNRFRLEAAALASIRSEHVVQAYAYGPADDSFFFVMEYVKGRSLESVLDRHAETGRVVPIHQAVALLRQITAGLAAVHSAGLVHRDVKPANVVIEDNTGRPVLIDFGLARRTDAGTRRARVTIQAGTPTYVAPEQAQSVEVDYRADQYAFGCTAFEVLSGRVPFEGSDPFEIIRKHIEEPPPRLSSVRKELARFDDILLRAMSKDPNERFESMNELGDALDRVAGPWFRADLRGLVQDPAEESQKRKGTRVLVAEPDEAVGKVLGRAAQVAFFGVRISLSTAKLEDEALDSARRVAPQIVLLGHSPPVFDGVAVLRVLRSLPAGANTAVVMLADDGGGLAKGAIERLGVSAVLPRNAPMPVLAEMIQKVAGEKGLLERKEGDVARSED